VDGEEGFFIVVFGIIEEDALICVEADGENETCAVIGDYRG